MNDAYREEFNRLQRKLVPLWEMIGRTEPGGPGQKKTRKDDGQVGESSRHDGLDHSRRARPCGTAAWGKTAFGRWLPSREGP